MNKKNHPGQKTPKLIITIEGKFRVRMIALKVAQEYVGLVEQLMEKKSVMSFDYSNSIN